ncbi:HNH endonuclease [Rubricoccus marinus]|uniref:HNH endonuclease n=1 Tax=Rubricoccus marinus TaxID=716817 RepID=UPI00117B7456|nr:HNH endonuclease [Rubricoccus marinus]
MPHGIQSAKEIREDVLHRLRSGADSVIRMPGRALNYRVNDLHVVNLRAASQKSADKYWFDVTPEFYEAPTVDFFVYACGSAAAAYIFPVQDFARMIDGASLGGQKQVPNFTLYVDTHEFEPAGRARSTHRVSEFYNRWEPLFGSDSDPDAPASEPSDYSLPDIGGRVAEPPPRALSVTERIIRDTALAKSVKEAAGYECGLCGIRLLLGPGKPYAESHHVRPLGGSHSGLDVRDNILCVCPNCHVLLDYGAVKLDPDRHPSLSTESVRYHNAVIAKSTAA